MQREFPRELERVRNRSMTGAEVLRRCCDEKLTDEDLNDEGNAFARAYYEDDTYLEDYVDLLGGGLSSLYHVADSWENYLILKPKIDQRFAAWRKKGGSAGRV